MSEPKSIYALEQWLDREKKKVAGGGGRPPTVDPPPPGGDNDGMEARVARLEADVDYIKRDVSEIKTDLKDFRKEAREDFRITFGVMVFITLGLAGLMAKGFGWL